MEHTEYLYGLLNKHISKHIALDDKNPVKSAMITTLDEVYELLNTDEARYYSIDKDMKEWALNGTDDYYSAFQLMLEMVSAEIGSGNLARRNPDVSPQRWCSWYADIVVNGYAKAMRDKFNMLANSYASGNEFLGRQIINESGLNLSHLQDKYKDEFNEL